MAKSAIETELQKATKVKAQEDRAVYLKELVEAALAMPSDQWDLLGTAAQNWVNAAGKAIDDEAEIEDFKKEASTKKEKTDKPAKEKTDKPAKEKKEKVAKEKVGPKALSDSDVKVRIKRAVIKNPNVTNEVLNEQLSKAGIKASIHTVNNIRSDFRHSLRVLVADGHLNLEL